MKFFNPVYMHTEAYRGQMASGQETSLALPCLNLGVLGVNVLYWRKYLRHYIVGAFRYPPVIRRRRHCVALALHLVTLLYACKYTYG